MLMTTKKTKARTRRQGQEGIDEETRVDTEKKTQSR